MAARSPATSYPRSARLTRKTEFDRVLARGEAFPGREVLVRRAANDLEGPRLGIAAPRAYGDAVRRNRLRRLVREAFRSVRARLGGHDLVVSPRRELREPTLDGIREDLLRTLSGVGRPARPGRRP